MSCSLWKSLLTKDGATWNLNEEADKTLFLNRLKGINANATEEQLDRCMQCAGDSQEPATILAGLKRCVNDNDNDNDNNNDDSEDSNAWMWVSGILFIAFVILWLTAFILMILSGSNVRRANGPRSLSLIGWLLLIGFLLAMIVSIISTVNVAKKAKKKLEFNSFLHW